MSSNPGWVELGVCGTFVRSCTWGGKKKQKKPFKMLISPMHVLSISMLGNKGINVYVFQSGVFTKALYCY